MLVHDFLKKSTDKYPSKIALIQGSKRYTYRTLFSEAAGFAYYLQKQSAETSFNVAISLPNSKEYVVAYYGTLMAGGCAVPFDQNLGAVEIDYRLRHSEATFWVTSLRCLKRFTKEFKEMPSSLAGILLVGGGSSRFPDLKVAIDVFDFGSRSKYIPDMPEVSEDSLASIIYTSGSTGKPKGVMLTHKNIVANTRSIVKYQQLKSSDIHMVVLPFHYVMGKSLLNTHFSVGGTLVLNNGFVFPNKALEEMAQERVTGFSGVPSTFALLLNRSAIRSYRKKLRSLRFVAQAGGHLPARLKRELVEVLPPNTQVFIMYGATEASARLSYLEPDKLPEKIDSIGRPIPGVSLKIMKSGRELDPGEEGEIVASGHNIMQGYWKAPDETRKVLDEHGYHTGDLGFKDEDGYFYVTGRTKEMIKVGGNRVSPKEIEELIWNSGLVEEVAVIGVPDEILGESIKAFVVPKNGRNDLGKTLKKHCGKTMPPYKVPKYIEVIRTLPKNAAGKVLKNKLAELGNVKNPERTLDL